MSKSTSQTKLRKRPKRCALGIYHTGAVLLFIGILVAIASLATPRLFDVYISDLRKPARFLYARIAVGLFSVAPEVKWLSLEQDSLQHGLELTDSQWIGAKYAVVSGLLVATASFILHVVLACRSTVLTWRSVVFEICGLLIAVIAVLIGLSLAENEIEYVHDHGDEALKRFLSVNQLLSESEFEQAGSANQDRVIVDAVATNLAEARGSLDGGDFALSLTAPQINFALLIAADFLFLVAFLFVLIYFVRLCEKAIETNKQLRSARTSSLDEGA
ncbi:hypothetical protein CRM22_006821 [Opisthorchis felineus]|uniref:Uncharacterized protein n=1 Tax=Opisthorchis felineus TaxID=147828 RepID=A0A4S2LJB0_OPIFE|nr:hypothetical protein CRM22_006821 [Opisthorchis felineus]